MIVARLLRHQHFHRLADQFLVRAIAEHRLGLGIDHLDDAVGVDHHHGVGRGLDHQAEALLIPPLGRSVLVSAVRRHSMVAPVRARPGSAQRSVPSPDWRAIRPMQWHWSRLAASPRRVPHGALSGLASSCWRSIDRVGSPALRPSLHCDRAMSSCSRIFFSWSGDHRFAWLSI